MGVIGIYKITSPSGKAYIGQSWNILKRALKYKSLNCKCQRKIYESIKKYGWINHVLELIHELPNDIDQHTLDAYEQLYMDLYRNCGIEIMNIREAGSRGKLSKESVLKMIKSRTGLPGPMRNKKHSEETKLKISEMHKGKCFRKNYVPSDETKKKQSEANKGKPSNRKGVIVSEATREKLSAASRGRKMSDVAKRKIAEKARKRITGTKLPEHVKLKMAESQRIRRERERQCQ